MRPAPPTTATRITAADYRRPIARSEGTSPHRARLATVRTPPPVVVVAAALVSGDRVLLCRRSATRQWYPGVWDLPDGHVEPGESPTAALVRELREELHIDVDEPNEPPAAHLSGPTFDMSVWRVVTWTNTPVNSAPDEHDEIRWCSLVDAAVLNLAHEDYPQLLKTLLQA